MASLDMTAADKALRTVYTKNKIKYVGYQKNPLLALLPKEDKFVGRNKAINLMYGGNQGRSRLMATAITNRGPGLYKEFLLTRVKDYGVSEIDMEAILASESEEGAFLKLATSEVDNTIRSVTRNLAVSLYRNKGGARGQVGSISTVTMTLKNLNDVTNFEVGMVLVQSTADGTSGSLGTGNSTVTGIDRNAGTLTAANWTNFTANDYIFQQGDFGVSVSGLSAYVPATAPTAGDAFFNVDRSTDSRLYGAYVDGSSYTISEAFELADVRSNREEGSPSHIMCNPVDFGTWRSSLGSAVVYDKVSSPDLATVSFSTIKMMGMGGEIQVVSDRNCPQGFAFMLDMSVFEWCTLGGGPRVLTRPGQNDTFIWSATEDSVLVRVGYYGNLACHKPGGNIQIKLPA